MYYMTVKPAKSLHVQDFSERIEDRFVHHLRQGRMREYGMHQVELRALHLAGDGIALDHLRHLGADHMRAQKLAGLGIENGLDQTFRLAQRDGLAVADELEASDLDVLLGLTRSLFRHADARHLRPAI